MADVALTALTVSAALAVGMVMALLGHLKLALARRPDQADSRVRNLLFLLNFLLIPLILLAGLLVDSWGVQAMLITGSVLLALAFLALSARLNYTRTLIAVAVAALGAAALHVAAVVQLPRGLFGMSEVAASLQLGMVFVGLGALVMPPLFDLLDGLLGFRRTMAVLAFLFLLPAFLTLLPPADDIHQAQGLAGLGDLFTDAGVIVAGFVFFVYAPLEAFVSVWVTTYLDSLGQPERKSRWLAGFWVAMLGSRFLFAIVLHLSTFGDNYLASFLILPAAFSAVILGNMSATIRHHRAVWGLVLLGLCLGPVYPMLLGILLNMRSVTPVPGSAYALLFTFGSVGSLLLSPLVRLSAGRNTIQAALRIPLLIALVLTAATLMFALLAGRGP